MKIPALYLPRAGFFIALKQFSEFLSPVKRYGNLSLHEENPRCRESIVGLSALGGCRTRIH